MPVIEAAQHYGANTLKAIASPSISAASARLGMWLSMRSRSSAIASGLRRRLVGLLSTGLRSLFPGLLPRARRFMLTPRLE
jgi:hypothetical protein